MGCINKLLLLLGQVSSKARNPFWLQPEATVCHFNIFKNVGSRELRLLALRSFIGIGAKRGDVDESSDPVIGSCGRDDTSTVRVTDQDGWAFDPPQCRFYHGNIAFGSVEAVLDSHCFVSLRQKGLNYFVEA